MRPALIFLLSWGMYINPAAAQMNEAPGTPYTFTGSMPIVAKNSIAMEHLLRAWKDVMAREPGAQVRITAPDELIGSARFPYRSEMLTAREETTGIITYRIQFKLKDGECHYLVNDMLHRGNGNTRSGGMHFGQLVMNSAPERNIAGLNGRNTERIYADMKAQIREHLRQVIAAMRQNLDGSAQR